MSHKLLLADDSVTIQRVVELTFAEENIAVISVGDGRQAIERIRAERPDVVLADVGMPERDGYDVAAFIKEDPSLSHIPVLLLAGAFEPIDDARARAIGCEGVLIKPFEPQVVIRRVRDLLEGRHAATHPGASTEADAAAQADAGSASPAATPGATLEDYFDRLDAAFASLGAAPGPEDAQPPLPDDFGRPVAPRSEPRPDAGEASGRGEDRRDAEVPAPPAERHGDRAAEWDPDVVASRQAPAATGSKPAPAGTHPWTPGPMEPGAIAPGAPGGAVHWDAVSHHPPAHLAEAFAALLSAERGQGVRPASDPPLLTEETMEELVRRVLDRMTERTVRETVLDVAERLVREEIERIKAGAR